MKNHIKKRQRERIKELKAHRPLSDNGADQAIQMNHESPRNDPEYEWKHGGVNPWEQERKSRGGLFLNYIKKSFVFSLVLFVSIWIWFQLPYSWAEPGKEHIRHLLTDEFPAKQMAKLYEQWLGGSPTLIPSFSPSGDQHTQPVQANNADFHPPIDGVVIQAYTPNKKGMRLAAEETRVTSAGEGRVMYVADEPTSGSLVIIQHADRIETLYGNLDHVLVKQNDWVRSGQPVGYLAEDSKSESILFFAMKRDNTFVDPADVIKFD